MSAEVPLGGLNDRLQWQRRITTAEDEGGHAVTYMPMLTLWGRVRPLGLSRSDAADGRGMVASHSVVIRHRGGIAPGDRFVVSGRQLEILGSEPLGGRKAYLACRCSERQVTG